MILLKKCIKFIFGDNFYRFASRFRLALYYQVKLMGYRKEHYDILFFCEQPSHWQNIQDVVGALLAKKTSLRIKLATCYAHGDYIDAEYPDTLSVSHNIPVGMLSCFKAKVLYTPYTSLKVLDKPKNCKVIHTLVSLTSLDGVYSPDAFNNYDYIICAGNHHIRDFQRWALINQSLNGKKLIPAGYPKLDLMLRVVSDLERPPLDQITVVYAPTHVYDVNEKMASLRRYGAEIISELLGSGFRVIFRPHPVSFKDADMSLIQGITNAHATNPNFILDSSKNYLNTYSKANLMITDLSGTGFTYSLSFLRPSIFFAPNKDSEVGMHGIQFHDRQKIGGVASSIDELREQVNRLAHEAISDELLSYRARTIYNIGDSAEYIVDALFRILSGNDNSEWITL